MEHMEFLLVVVVAGGITAAVVRSQLKKPPTSLRSLVIIASCVFFLFLCHDIITHLLAGWFCLSGPHPKTFVLRKVDKPGSIYFEDCPASSGNGQTSRWC